MDAFLALNKEDIEFNNRKVSIEASAKRMREGGGDERRGGGGVASEAAAAEVATKEEAAVAALTEAADQAEVDRIEVEVNLVHTANVIVWCSSEGRSSDSGSGSSSGKRTFAKRSEGDKPAFGKSEFKRKKY